VKVVFASFLSLVVAGASFFSGCSSTASETAGIEQKLQAVRRSYDSCVTTLGADAPPCKALANGVDQLAQGAAEFDSAASTAAAIKAEEAARRSMMDH
jgi:type IV secretory pathway TrbL component